MLTSLRLGNFKAFASTQHLPIKPLTLLFGPNSAGKSSLIHGLLYAQHAAETGELDVHSTAIGGEAVDLGGFSQFVYGHATERQLEIELQTSTRAPELAGLPWLTGLKTLSINTRIGQQHEEFEQKVYQGRDSAGDKTFFKVRDVRPKGRPRVELITVSVDDAELLVLGWRPDRSYAVERLNTSHPSFARLLGAIIDLNTTSQGIGDAERDGLASLASELASGLRFDLRGFLPLVRGSGEESGPLDGPGQMLPVSRTRRAEDLAAALRLFLPRHLRQFANGVTNSFRADLEHILYLGPLRSYPPRFFEPSYSADPTRMAGGGDAWARLVEDKTVLESVNRWLSSEDRLQTPYELAVRKLISPLSPRNTELLESAVEEELGKLHELIDDNTEQEEHPPNSEDAAERADASRAADYRDVSDQLTGLLQTRLAQGHGIDQPVLIDRRSNTEVSHRDVGIGISQVLPVLVLAYADMAGLAAIEQPEIHLHPALQAELGDVFIESAMAGLTGPFPKRFLLETHSEHLMLRILRRIRETTAGELPSNTAGITPQDVEVVYARPTREGTVLHEIPITEDGEFEEKWPGGFFAERSRELF